MKKSIVLGKIFGIEIHAHYSWIFIILLLVYSLSTGYFPSKYPEIVGITLFFLSLTSAILLFATILAHELCHSLVAKHFGIKVESIYLFFFGGMAQIQEEEIQPKQEILMAIAGPLFSLCFAFICFAIELFLTSGFWLALISYIARVNLVVGIFNLVPGYPLDGGRVMRGILWLVLKDVKKATYYASRGGVAFGSFLMIMGLLTIILNGNFGGIWFILIGFFLYTIAELNFSQMILRDILHNVNVGRLARKHNGIKSNETVQEVIENHLLQDDKLAYPIMDKKLKGILRAADVVNVAKQIRSKIKIKSVMIPLEQLHILTPNDNLYDALKLMDQQKIPMLPVIYANKIKGYVTRKSIERYLVIKETGKNVIVR